MRFILDTDTFSLLQKENEKIIEKLASSANEVGISIVTKAEVLNGRYAFLLKAENSERLIIAQKWLLKSEKLLERFSINEFDETSLAIFDEFRQQSKFRKIGRADLLIASICLSKDAVLITRNVKHFRQFPNLIVENWVD